MRRAIFMMLLATVSSSATAEWVKVGSNESFTLYIDPATIRKADDRVKMWGLSDYKTPQVYMNRPSMSTKAQAEYDCKEGQSRLLYLSSHPENMGGGEAVYTDTNTHKWRPVSADTFDKAMWKTACGYSHSSIKRSRKERVYSAVHRIISVQYAEGENGVRPILLACYSTAVAAQAGLSDDLVDCIAQDIAFTIFSTDFFQAMAKEYNKTLVELQSPFTRADSSIGRITGALKSVGITDSSHSVELKEIARLSQAALQAVDLKLE